jgi:hypothetical protein
MINSCHGHEEMTGPPSGGPFAFQQCRTLLTDLLLSCGKSLGWRDVEQFNNCWSECGHGGPSLTGAMKRIYAACPQRQRT